MTIRGHKMKLLMFKYMELPTMINSQATLTRDKPSLRKRDECFFLNIIFFFYYLFNIYISKLTNFFYF